jgi:SAM-dependent methyltransferase
MSDVDPTALFEPLYVAAAEGRERLRWDRGGPHPLIDEWARGLTGSGGRALVVGSGLGPDAELFAERGFEVVGFDVSPTTIASAHARFPQSRVDYRVANLLGPPAEWSHAFDLVVESLTVQSMPVAFHAQAIANVARMVAPGGTLIVVAKARDGDRPVDGPPWPLTRTELEEFAADGLDAVRIEDVRRPGVPAQWRAEFRRDPADPITALTCGDD